MIAYKQATTPVASRAATRRDGALGPLKAQGEPEHPQQDPPPDRPRDPVDPGRPQQPELPPVSPHTPTVPQPQMDRDGGARTAHTVHG